MTGTSEIPSGTGEAAAQRPDRGTPPRQPEKPQVRLYSMAASLALVAWLVILAAAGAGARALYAPPPYAAAAAWLALAAALAWLSRRRFWTGRGHPGRHYRAADPWRPGDPFPEGIPAATMEAAGRQAAATMPDGEGITVLLGEHAAQRPLDAAFCLAHEIHHTFGWRWHMQAAEALICVPGWLAAGWAVPWPWLPAALAVLQCIRLAAHWVNETGCDVAAGRMEGREAAGAAFAVCAGMRAARRASRPAWQRRNWQLAAVLAGQASPPLWLRRAAIRSLVPA
jgi:hypothetical protein